MWYAAGIGVLLIVFGAVGWIGVNIKPHYSAPSYNEEYARCRSMGGSFSFTENALCFVDGEVV